MAFDALRPHQSQILGLMDQGRTLAQIVDVLAAQHGVATTPGTLSRFATSVRTSSARTRAAPARAATPASAKPPPLEKIPAASPPSVDPRPPQLALELTPAQHARVDDIALRTEILAELHASRQESRDILEHLAGKIAGLSADIVELEKAVVARSLMLDHGCGAEPSAPAPVPPVKASVPARVILRIWVRALVITGLVWGAVVVMRGGW